MPDLFREAEDLARYQGEGPGDRPEPDEYDRADQERDALIDDHLSGEHRVEPVLRCPECRKETSV